ncbi:YhcH/YjgK/YiaL family protein [Chitinophaga alhagiae]|uniref:YhcH/YjgK/YiaL family protein n=1 Tax=Chitinophaga alhagiae TaxID=2203219 RepID=UPI000E5ACDBA|nr:YhcH/YjgK/YiaL family protein [Chitinophaga alhagiae]
MIIDSLDNAHLYHGLGPRFVKAFEYLQQTDFSTLEKGKYEIEGNTIFAIVNEYQTVDPAGEQMEAHKKYIDVQYVAKGEEQIGHDFLNGQTPSRAYDGDADYMLFGERPAFFSRLAQHQFAIFFPSDLHMPNLTAGVQQPVKKVVIKISVA